MTGTEFLHPAFWFLGLALILIALPSRAAKYFILLPGALAVYSVLHMVHGEYGSLPYLGTTLVLGRVDDLSIIFAHVFAIQALIGFIYAWHIKEKAHHIFAALYVAGGFGCVFAGVYLTLFIFWELMSVASTMLIWLNRNPRSTKAGFRYFVFHTLGGLFLLAGLLLRYHATGSLEFTSILPASAQWYDYLILTGFCVNAALIPLHAWLPDAYPEATIPGAVFMSAFTTKTAVYVLLRGFAGFEILAIAGTVMAVYGVFYATIENNTRRILSYHIVSQVGYMVAGIGVGTAMTLNGACAHAYAHILYKGLLFMSAGALLYATGTAKLTELGGLVRSLPWVFLAYMVAAVSISGVPLFSGFVSKTMVIAGAAESHRLWVTTGLELASVGTFLSVGLKLPYFAFYGRPETPGRKTTPIPWNMYLAMGLASFLCLFIGVYPSFLYDLLPHAVHYEPYTAWHVLQISLLLGFTGYGFYLLVKKLAPEDKRNVDFEYVYIKAGRAFLALCRIPFARLDTLWSEVYRVVGMRGLLLFASLSSVFDRKGIDGVVDGLAVGVRGTGRKTSLLQSGHLQQYVAAAVLLGFIILGLAFLLT